MDSRNKSFSEVAQSIVGLSPCAISMLPKIAANALASSVRDGSVAVIVPDDFLLNLHLSSRLQGATLDLNSCPGEFRGSFRHTICLRVQPIESEGGRVLKDLNRHFLRTSKDVS